MTPDLHDELRSALGQADAADFDYDALVAGTKARAARIRRRRAVSRGVAAVVLAPTLVAAGWFVGNNLGGLGEGEVGLEVAATTEDRAEQTSEPVTEDPTTSTSDPSVTTSSPSIDEVTETVTGPPWQDEAPPAPEAGPEPLNPDWPNRLEIPDPRPTGVAFLDALGAPAQELVYPRQAPLISFATATEYGGVEPHSGRSWDYHDGTNFAQDTVTVQVTAWDDSASVMTDLLDPAATDVAFTLDADGRTLPWPGGEQGGDRLLISRDVMQGYVSAGALVRQGDYLVGVTVTTTSQEEAVAAATEIAQKTVENLAVLDPEHAGQP